MKPDERSGSIWAWAFGLLPVVWLARLVAPAVSGGIPAIIEYFPAAMSAPFHIEWCGRVAESNFCGTPILRTNQEKNGGIASKSNQPKPKKV